MATINPRRLANFFAICTCAVPTISISPTYNPSSNPSRNGRDASTAPTTANIDIYPSTSPSKGSIRDAEAEDETTEVPENGSDDAPLDPDESDSLDAQTIAVLLGVACILLFVVVPIGLYLTIKMRKKAL
eukprot:647129_1